MFSPGLPSFTIEASRQDDREPWAEKIGSFPLFNLPAEYVPAQDSLCALGAPIILSIPLWLGLNPSFHQLLRGKLRIPESVGCGVSDHSYLPQACQTLFLASTLKRILESAGQQLWQSSATDCEKRFIFMSSNLSLTFSVPFNIYPGRRVNTQNWFEEMNVFHGLENTHLS